ALGGRGSAGTSLICLSVLMLLLTLSFSGWQYSLARELYIARRDGPHEVEITPAQINEAQQEILIVTRHKVLSRVYIDSDETNILKFKVTQLRGGPVAAFNAVPGGEAWVLIPEGHEAE